MTSRVDLRLHEDEARLPHPRAHARGIAEQPLLFLRQPIPYDDGREANTVLRPLGNCYTRSY